MSATVTVPGYTLTGVAGFGADGAVRRGTDADGRPVALRFLTEAPAGLRARVQAAARVHDPGVAGVLGLVELADGLAVVQDFIDGPTLSTLRAARRGLSVPECTQLAGGLLAALEGLHAAGIIHGDVSPANVIVTPTEEGAGRPVLVDLVGGAGPDRGTRGFRAPEVDTGAALGTAADVYSAAQLSLWAAESGAREEVAALLAPLLCREPGERPSARRARQLLDGGAQVAIALAPAEVLASATLREHAARELTTRARSRRLRPRRRHRAVGPRQWLLRAAAAAVLLTLVTGSAVWQGAVDLTPEAPPKAAPVSMAAGIASRVAQAAGEARAGHVQTSQGQAGDEETSTDTTAEIAAAVHDLLARRDAALTARDAVALADATVPGSPLAAADATVLTELTDADLQLRGYRTEVVQLRVLSRDPATAAVQAELSQPAHERLAADGSVSRVPEQPARCVRLELDRTGDDASWRATTATPC
ncbi:serine/threonine-protein kinase [Ruania zhangjianzhongii]|uniref:serine/threonine-protein kinase n=1 Tax=Ruania zhangjianzhongii TaxID=2603206 RepID=UPI0011C7DA68|nr:hypothetical protein [Ruania zhangjianzhongii]